MHTSTETIDCPLCLGVGSLKRSEILDRLGVKDLARVAQLSAEEVFVIPAVFVDPDIFKEKRGPLKTLCDLETLIAYGFIVADILGPDPGRFQKLHRICQFSIKAKISRILETAVLLFFSLS